MAGVAGYDLYLNAEGDYELDDEGNLRTTQTASSAVRHALLDEIDAWPADPDAGSELHLIRGGGNTQANLVEAGDRVRLALDPLVAAGMISDVEVDVQRDNQGRFFIAAQSRDNQSGDPIDLPLDAFGVS